MSFVCDCITVVCPDFEFWVWKTCFSANSIYLESGNRSSKFRCWRSSLIQAKWSLWERHKIGNLSLNRRWLIGADSLRAVTMTTAETSTLLRIWEEALAFAIIKGLEIITKYNLFLNYFCLASFFIIFAWNDQVWFLKWFLFLLSNNYTVWVSVDGVTDMHVCTCFLVMFTYQLIHLLSTSLYDQHMWTGSRRTCFTDILCLPTHGRKAPQHLFNVLC